MRFASVFALLLVACGTTHPDVFPGGGGGGGGGGGTETKADLGAGDLAGGDLAGSDLAGVTLTNTVPIIVDDGPAGLSDGSYDVAFVTVTLCAPGDATNCTTIDHVTVDTGSVGLRVLSSALTPAFAAALPNAKDASKRDLAECFVFVDGYVWGSVRTADLTIGGEHVSSLPFQLIGDPALSTVPADCTSSGDSVGTLADFGGNGLIGLSTYAVDCGDQCEDPTYFGGGYNYYGCATASTCSQVTLPQAQQVANPAALMDVDNNGVVIELPTIDDAGQSNVPGTLTFGIDTQPNNALGSAVVLTVGDEDSTGTFSVVHNNHTYTNGYIDSGTNDYSFSDSTIPACKGDNAGFDCPGSLLTTTADNIDAAKATHTVTLKIANTDSLFVNTTANAFDDIADDGDAGDNTTFVWGLPFFFGKRVFTAISGKTTSGGPGPYYAY